MWLGFCSLKGSPGATTLGVVVAGLWPKERRALLIEADSDGGALAGRFGLKPNEPGIPTLVAAARHGMDEEIIWRNTQTLPGGLPALLCPTDPQRAETALAALAAQTSEMQEHLRGCDVMVDLGRLRRHPTQQLFLNAVDLLTVTVRPVFEDLNRLLESLENHEGLPPVGIVLAGAGPYSVEDVNETFSATMGGQATVIGHVGFDPRGAAALNLGRGGPRAFRRSLLVRSTRAVVEAICP
jgi:MinD-like ATPase involved in chromosome partitioning or flagellar assembly